MAELADMLKNILDDPATAQKLKGLLGGISAPPSEAAPSDTSGLDPVMLMRITNAMKKMNSGENDNRTRLLSDLKPYISPARRRRVDDAINILRMLWVVDIMKNDGEGE